MATTDEDTQAIDDERIVNYVMEDRLSFQVVTKGDLAFATSEKYPGVIVDAEDHGGSAHLIRPGVELDQLVELFVGVAENTITFPDRPRPCRVCGGADHLPDCELAADLDEDDGSALMSPPESTPTSKRRRGYGIARLLNRSLR